MTSTSSRIPPELDRHLATAAAGEHLSTAAYVERGAELVNPQALSALRSLRPALAGKIAGIEEGSRLRRRLDVMSRYFDEASEGNTAPSLPLREVTFALLYLLNGADRIPDSVPEVGLLDDALVVQTVLDRHSTALKGHWLRHQRAWDEDL